jgi:hypothetical protein
VYEAINPLEGVEILTWVNRLIRVQYRERHLFGRMALRSRLVPPAMPMCFGTCCPARWPV